MKSIINSWVCILILLVVFTSCKKEDYINPNDISYTNDLEQFVTIWTGISTSYVLWPFDTTDWDRIYSHYYNVFDNDDTMTDEAWEYAWKELTSSLIDHHLYIRIKRPATRYTINISLGEEEIRRRSYYHDYIYPRFLQMVWSGRVTDEEYYGSYSCGIIDSTIAYLYLLSFKFQDTNKAVKSIIDHYKRLLLNSQVRAAIVDLRSNSGGKAGYLGMLMSCFVDKPYTVGYNQRKVGLGRLDLGMKVPFSVIPDHDAQHVDIPIVVLADVHSGSTAEIATLAIKMLPNGYFIGERTVGATCGIIEGDPFGVFGNGDFSVSSGGHYVSKPSYLFTGVDGTCYEGYGIEPDETCYFNKEDWERNIDNQLEFAIQFALEKANER